MSINRSGSQTIFESIFTRNSGPPFRGISKIEYISTSINQSQANQLKLCLHDEAKKYYYKAVVSFAEAINRLEYNSYSWPTVELYYSAYYATRSVLNNFEYAILRAERRLYCIRARANESFQKCDNTTDHKATFEVLRKRLSDDYLLSNTVDGQVAYDWIMEKREEVNYRDIDFHEPQPPEFWETINQELSSRRIWSIIDQLYNDTNGLFCFQPDYAILGIPINRLKATCNELKKSGFQGFPPEQQQFVHGLLSNCSAAFLSSIT